MGSSMCRDQFMVGALSGRCLILVWVVFGWLRLSLQLWSGNGVLSVTFDSCVNLTAMCLPVVCVLTQGRFQKGWFLGGEDSDGKWQRTLTSSPDTAVISAPESGSVRSITPLAAVSSASEFLFLNPRLYKDQWYKNDNLLQQAAVVSVIRKWH